MRASPYFEWWEEIEANGLIELPCQYTHPLGFTGRRGFGWCNLLSASRDYVYHRVKVVVFF